MSRGASLRAFGHATSAFLAISFALCVLFDLAFPAHAMFRTWQALLPGFHWISWGSFFLGLIESYGYGWYTALIFVPIYNVAVYRRPQRAH